MNKLGISIAIYNGNINYLNDLFKSLEDTQKHGDFLEVVIVDNGSDSLDFWNKVQEFSEGKSYIKIKRFEKNEGKKQATWYALNNLKSKYVQVLDYDDYLIPENISKVIDILYSENPDIAFLNYPYFSDKKQKIKKYRKPFKGTGEYKIINKVPKTLWHFDTNTIINKEMMMNNSFEFPDEVTRYEDVFINMWNLQFAKKVALINVPIYTYRINVPGQLSSTSAMMKNFEMYRNTVLALSKLNFSNDNTRKNMKYIFELNYLSFSYFNSISKLSRKEVKKNFKELKKEMKSHKIKKGVISHTTDIFTLRRKNYALIFINKFVLFFRK